MMRKFAAALLATALIAGPAFAASPMGDAGKSPVGTAAPANTAGNQTVKPAKTVKTHQVRKHRRHVVRHKAGKITYARHINRLKKHRHYVAHVAKPAKVEKAGKSDKS